MSGEVGSKVYIPFEAGAGGGAKSGSARDGTEFQSKAEEGAEVGGGRKVVVRS